MNLLNKLQSTSHGSCTLMGFINLALYKCHGTGNKIGDPILHGSKMQDTVGRIIARQENRFNIGFITIMFILTKHYARTFKVLSYKFKMKDNPVVRITGRVSKKENISLMAGFTSNSHVLYTALQFCVDFLRLMNVKVTNLV